MERVGHQTDVAAGEPSFALPFYGVLEDQGFEEFCEDLLCLNPTVTIIRGGHSESRTLHTASRLLSGTAQKGGDIRAEDDQGGLWVFQCKRVKAFRLSELKEAIDLAEQGFPHADRFVLVTTCSLSEAVQGELAKRPNWQWWNPLRLTSEATRLRPREEAINLVRKYFGPDHAKRLFSCPDHPLLTWEEFFAQDLSDERREYHHRSGFVGHGEVLAELEAFADSGADQALILSAPGGQGKSRILLELARRMEQRPGSPRVRFLNIQRQGLDEDQRQFLAREEAPLLLIVDDAHRLDTAIGDLARATAPVPSIRLLIATRPQAVEAVKSQLYRNGYVEEKLREPLRLSRWTDSDLQALARDILLPQFQVEAASLSALADRCPVLVVMGGAMINSGKRPGAIKDKESFRQRVFKSFIDEFVDSQPSEQRALLKRLIQFLSFVSPAPRDQRLLTTASKVTGADQIAVDEALGMLETAGLLAENRQGIRLYPDLLADAVLLDASLGRSGRPSALHRQLVEQLSLRDFPSWIRNIAQADWETREERVGEGLFEPLWPEFLRLFGDGVSRQPKPAKDEAEQSDALELLDQWASFAVYLPEKTLELADVALTRAAARSDPLDGAWSRIATSLVPLLKQVAEWHPKHTPRALDLLWSLKAGPQRGDLRDNTRAIAAIADAASFTRNKPLQTSEVVLDWLDRKLHSPAVLETLKAEPWIVSALLKPFFGREIEHSWQTGMTVHMTTLLVDSNRTRGLRARALKIVKGFLNSENAIHRSCVVPILGDALQPPRDRFGLTLSAADHEVWRSDRLEALKALETAAHAHAADPALLLQLRSLLLKRCKYDPDAVVQAERKRVLDAIPDTFELRVLRVLTSWAHHEWLAKADMEAELDLDAAERAWAEFRLSVAKEVKERFGTAREVIKFVEQQVSDLPESGATPRGSELIGALAELSEEWCGLLLTELVEAREPSLDRSLGAALRQATGSAPEIYLRAIRAVSERGRPEQLGSLISHFGWKQLQGGGLSSIERECVLHIATCVEASVVCNLATMAGLHLAGEPRFALEVLRRLEIESPDAGRATMEALARIVLSESTELEPSAVAECLAHAGRFAVGESAWGSGSLQTVSERFPREVYEHLRGLCEGVEPNSGDPAAWNLIKEVPLGRIEDDVYVDRELTNHWNQALAANEGSFARRFRMKFMQALIWSDARKAPGLIRTLVEGCGSAGELKLAVDIVGVRGSRFAFAHPEIVRLMLLRGEELLVGADVREALRFSACGGGRSYSNGELNPEYRYIREQGEALANSYRDDPELGRFYNEVVEYERECVRIPIYQPG